MGIEQYFNDYKNRKSLPTLKVGKSATIKEFYDDCIKPTLISKNNAIAWHNMLMEYIKRDDAIFLLRKYEGGSKVSGRWNTRRSAMTRFADGFTYVFVSNFEAHEIYNMAFKGVVPTAEEFARLLNNHLYPMHYDNGKSRSCEEIDISAYPHIGNVKSGVLNESRYYLAHIHSVNGADYVLGNGSSIPQKDIEAIAPRGELSDWNASGGYPIREFECSLKPEQKAYVVAHFLRFVDPLNYFLTPVKSHTNVKNISWKKNIGEYPELIGFVSEKYKKIFGRKLITEFYEKAMVSSKKNNQRNLGDHKIVISYGTVSQNNSQTVSKTAADKKAGGKRAIADRSELIPIVLNPQDVKAFKKLLLKKRKAIIKLTYCDGRAEIKSWNAKSFTEKSDVMANIRSRQWWRNRNSLGISKVEVGFSN